MIEVLNREKFSHMVEKLVIAKRISYMDAVVWWCEEIGRASCRERG
mgnify:CR=1 FL=1